MGTVKAMATNEPAGQLVGAGLWTWLKGTGLERFELVRAGAAWTLRGCLDVDLSWSPSTNTLPIRRLGLEVGQASAALTAAWVRFPDLALIPLEQEYRRLSDRRYRYTSRGGAFTAEIDVDEHGLVVNYGDFWKRVAGS